MTAHSLPHEAFMRRALVLARRGTGRTSPNPAVGAVIVSSGRIIAEGWHRRAGGPHAEVLALGKAPAALRRATIYVTLEPCSHFGRTPPCVDAVIASGIKKAVIGMKDPNPRVSGEGIRMLRAAGVEVTTGVLERECRAINAPYVKYITTGAPFVTIKLASTLDGRTATSTGESKWITGGQARRLVHRMRSRTDAVLTGSNTVLKDDPELTVRHVRGRDPLRAVLDSSFSVPLSAKALRVVAGAPAPLLFTTRAAPREKVESARRAGVEVVVVGRGRHQAGVSLKSVLKELGRREITSVLVEGGGILAASFIKERLADAFSLFIAPALLGADALPSVASIGVKRLSTAPRLSGLKVRKVGPDVLIEGGFDYTAGGRG
ncbi:MAG: bifunctional diaminohydroxyphosphoribosylaminopyrimidine deaminase/5-amino-6-(5-phosphoribosylamino)uracil reductase RibD [Thermodesulfobacteriota bacterium]